MLTSTPVSDSRYLCVGTEQINFMTIQVKRVRHLGKNGVITRGLYRD